MENRIIKRTIHKRPLWEILEDYQLRKRVWETKKTVCIVEGLAGCGKTAYLLEYFKSKHFFYFSFAGYGEELAEKLISERVTEATGTVVSDWVGCFKAIKKKYKYVIFDDLSSISTYKNFKKAFYDYIITNILTRPFVVLITQPDDDVADMADKYDYLNMGYFLIPEVMKLYPSLSKYDTLGLCALTGGIPKILGEYDIEKPYEDNLRNMFVPSSAFCNFMPELLSRYFRRTEVYHHVMLAIAGGNHSISDIGKYTGFAYNKCDNYLSKLVEFGFVKKEDVISKRGAEKTAYKLTNNYFRLWHLYVFTNRTEIQLRNHDLIESITGNIIDEEIHAFHVQRAMALVNERIRWKFWESLGEIKEKVQYNPQTVISRNFQYEFDAIAKNGEKAVFVKVFRDPLENCKREELERLRDAVALVNTYYDSQIFVFSKRRFSDYAVREAANDDNLSIVEVDRLKY